MFVLVQVWGKVQAQQQPTGIHPSMIVLQEQREAPGAQKQTWCMKQAHTVRWKQNAKVLRQGKKRLCISWHMLPIMQNFSMQSLFTTHKTHFIEICELVNTKVINVFFLKN